MIEQPLQTAKKLFNQAVQFYESWQDPLAFYYFNEARLFNYPPAYQFLGFMFNHGYGVSVNLEQASLSFTNAMMCAALYPQAMNDSDVRYALGIYWWREQNYPRAVEFFHNVDTTNPNVLYYLGLAYNNGLGVQQDYNTALIYFKSAALTHIAAQHELGCMYYLGHGTAQNYHLGYSYFYQAASHNHALALFATGYCLLHGLGVHRNTQSALNYFLRGAQQNHNNSQKFAGLCYFLGLGTPIDLNNALYWFECVAPKDAGIDYFLKYYPAATWTNSTVHKHAAKWLELHIKHAFTNSTLAINYTQTPTAKNNKTTATVSTNHNRAIIETKTSISKNNTEQKTSANNQLTLSSKKPLHNNFKFTAVKIDPLESKLSHNILPSVIPVKAPDSKPVPQLPQGDKFYLAKNLFECGIQDYLSNLKQDAFKNFQKAAAENYPAAYLFLSYLDAEAKSKNHSKPDYELASSLLRNASGMPEAAEIYYDWSRACVLLKIADQNSALHKAAQLGHAEAQYNLSQLCLKFSGIAEKFGNALDWLIKAAEQNHIEAQADLGAHYLTEKQFILAIKWLQKASDKNNVNALYNLANHYLQQRQFLLAEEYYIKAAKLNHVDAQYTLGVGYIKTKNYDYARFWLAKAVENGSLIAQDLLEQLKAHTSRPHTAHWEFKTSGLIEPANESNTTFQNAAEKNPEEEYSKASSLLINPNSSAKEIAKAFLNAAELGHSDAQYRYGLYCINGVGVKRSKHKGLGWLTKAADQGHREATEALKQFNTPQSPPQTTTPTPKPSISIEKLESKTSIPSSDIQHESKATKSILEVDLKFATAYERHIFKEALKDPEKICELAILYFTGSSRGKSFIHAIFLFEKLAEKGDFEGCYHIGECYEQGGFGVEKDEQRAKQYYLKAFNYCWEKVRKGENTFHSYLAKCFAYGNGVNEDHYAALTHALLAEKAGSTDSRLPYIIAFCYYSGKDNVIPNYEKAKHWINIAIKRGFNNDDVKEFLKKLKAKFPDYQQTTIKSEIKFATLPTIMPTVVANPVTASSSITPHSNATANSFFNNNSASRKNKKTAVSNQTPTRK